MEAALHQQSIERWMRRLERAAALISQRLDDPPTLDELASAAAVSPFHLHRIWRALVGETVGETVRRLRLEASQELLQMEGANIMPHKIEKFLRAIKYLQWRKRLHLFCDFTTIVHRSFFLLLLAAC